VIRVGTNTLGGQIVIVLGPGLEWRYYAHLDRYGEFHEGDVVNAGDLLGYVGNTGNAPGTPTHLPTGSTAAAPSRTRIPVWQINGTVTSAKESDDPVIW